MKVPLFNLLCVSFAFGVPTKYSDESAARNTCGYQSCVPIDASTLNVHLVPHSHDDVGWLKTVDQYYWGAETFIQRAGVQYILDSVVTALNENPDRRFIQVETAFFHKWWKEQSENRRELVRELVNSGRLEIINGAWSMNDEAAVHYQSIIDQFTLGLRTINDTLGECGRPKIGWQIDPFGHSREMASIFSQMGYDGLFFSRLDWRDKNARLYSKTPEMLWQGSSNLGDNSNLFTSILYNHYSAPSGYCFDILCTDTPIIDDVDSTEYNYKEKIDGFAAFINAQAINYVTNNIIITMGDDFNYQDALTYFKNMDKLVQGFKDFPHYAGNKLVKVFYSTPSCYVKAVNDEAAFKEIAFPLKTDDFFPYASDPNTYWSGYYTSRPTSKRFERQGNNILQVTKQLASFFKQSENELTKLRKLQEAMGIMQHHDAITGTEKQHVADDYHRILAHAIKGSIDKINDLLPLLLFTKSTETPNLNLKHCLLTNVSICEVSQLNQFIAVIYNPLSRPVSHYVRLPVQFPNLQVVGSNGEHVASQILPSMDEFSHLSIFNPAPLELIFLAENIPALGAKAYTITLNNMNKYPAPVAQSNCEFSIGDGTNGVELDPSTGLLRSITLNGNSLAVKQELMYYLGASGDNMDFTNRASGAYIFRPHQDCPVAIPFDETINITIYTGNLVDEIHQTFSSWAKQVIRLYKNTNYVEFDWLVGPINVNDLQGREVISRFSTDLNTDDIFYTDANGREMIQRRRDYRNTYTYTNEEKVAGNYYPVTSKIVLKDIKKNLEFAVLNDRAQGGSSLTSGQVELMVHRRLLEDDAFGVGEALNELQYGIGLIARGQHYVTFGPSSVSFGKTSAAIQRDIAQQKLLAPLTFVSSTSNLWMNLTKKFAGLTRNLPDNVQILTLEPWRTSDNTLLLRLEHVLEKHEDSILSKNASIDLNGLFTYFEILNIQEMTLDGNQPINQNDRLKWIVGDEFKQYFLSTTTRKLNYSKPTFKYNIVDLTPMQIRTFLLNVVYK